MDSCKHPRRDHIPYIKLIVSCDPVNVATGSSLTEKVSLIGEKKSTCFFLTCGPTSSPVHHATPESSLLEECLIKAEIPVDCAVLDQEITNLEHIADIADELTEWRNLFPYFGLEKHKKDDIEAVDPIGEQRRTLLLMWIEKNGPRATYRNICILLLRRHRADVVKAVCTAVKDIISV